MNLKRFGSFLLKGTIPAFILRCLGKYRQSYESQEESQLEQKRVALFIKYYYNHIKGLG
jgi:hypothetical protein